MSRVDELIREHCSDGVEHLSLGDVAAYSKDRVGAEVLDDETFVGVDNLLSDKRGKVPASYRPNTAMLTAYQPGDILLGNIRPYLKKVWLADREGGCSGDVLAIRRMESSAARLSPRFLYYLLSSDGFFVYNSQHAKGAKMPRGSKDAILRYRIPVPPLEVQAEIVRVLDLFQSLEAELEAELEARRRQYAHYRDSLLGTGLIGAASVRLGEILELVIDHRGKTPKKLGGDWVERGHRVISALNFQGGEIDTNDHHYITNEIYRAWMREPLRRGDVLLTSEAPLGAVAFLEEDVDWALGQRVFGLRPRHQVLDGRFLYHLLAAGPPRRELLRRATGSTVVGIRQAELVKVEIPVPPIEAQARIATMLDKFDALVNDLSVGLPAELVARRRQYEHYRDRLLSFEEAA